MHEYSLLISPGSHLGWIYINLALVRMPPYLREYSSSRLKHIPPELTRVCMHVHRISGAAVQLCRASDAPASRRRRPRVHARTYRSMFFLSLSLSLSVCLFRVSLFLLRSHSANDRVNKGTRMAANSKMEQQPHPAAIIRHGGESCAPL